MTAVDEFQEKVAALEATLGGTEAVVVSFDNELKRMQSTVEATGRDVGTLSRSLSSGLKRAFDGVVFDGKSLASALDTVAQSMVNAAYNAAIRPVTNHFGGLLASGIGNLLGGFANGGAFTQGRVMPFAQGGVVSRATAFPMRGGMGLMGEAGPEANLPLARGADGRLGVESQGGGRTVNVVMNISTPDAQSFRRSESQVAAQMSRVLSRADRMG